MSDQTLRVIFMGTPDFAVPTLDALLHRGHDVVGVFTQPDRPAGRGRKLRPSPVKTFSVQHDLPVFQPTSLRRDPDACTLIANLEPDAIVVAAYGLFLPGIVLDTPRHGCLNIHPSLLPRHRGPSPVISTILDGDETGGVTIMLLDEGMDTGPVLAQEKTHISSEETADVLTHRLFGLGAVLLVRTLDRWVQGEIAPSTQYDERGHGHATPQSRVDGRLDWYESAEAIERRIRAFTPWPGTFTTWGGKTLKLVRGRLASASVESDARFGVSGSASDSIVVATGSGALELLEIQLEGRAKAGAADFARGQRDFVGSVLGN